MADGEEMGEDEMMDEEGEMEMDEEGEEELMDEDEECPDLVPGDKDFKVIVPEGDESSEVISDVDVDSSSSSEYNSDELDKDTTANPHGFVFSNMLDTFTKSRKDRIATMKEEQDRDAHRDKFKKKRIDKNIGKSNKVKERSKPFMMIKKKKILDNTRKFENKLNAKKIACKQLGKFRKSTQQKIESKRRNGRKL